MTCGVGYRMGCVLIKVCGGLFRCWVVLKRMVTCEGDLCMRGI